jgi:hypothetical protein
MNETNALVAGSFVIEDDITWIAGLRNDRNGKWVLQTPPKPTPSDALDDPVEFIERLSRTAHRLKLTGITVILDASASKMLGLPSRVPRTKEEQENHPLIAEWNAAKWNIGAVSPWMNLWRPDRAGVHLGILPWLRHGKRDENCPFPIDDRQHLAELLARFHRLTGTPYHGNHAGLPGMALLRDGWHRARGSAVPRWSPKWEGCTPAKGDTEKTIASSTWNKNPARFSKGFDAVRQYLPAAANALVSPDALRHTGAVPWTRRRSGYWRIISPVWNIDGLPNPSNYPTGADCWVTGPTMELIAELAEKGFTEEPRIIDSWTAEGAGEHLRPWANHIEKCYSALRTDESPDGALLRSAVKDMYKKGIGVMFRAGGRVRRPDWHHAIIAKARTNLFRKMFGVWELTGQVPDSIHYDEIWYSFDNADDVPMRWRGNKRIPAFPTESDTWGNFTVTTRENR